MLGLLAIGYLLAIVLIIIGVGVAKALDAYERD